MSAENVELIRRLYEWFADGEAEKAFEYYDPGIEWDASGTPWMVEMGSPPVSVGHDAVRAGFRAWLEAWESIEYDPYELLDCGDEVLAFVRVAARGRASGMEVNYETPQLWTMREGKVTRMRVFDDREVALRAAGLA
jgi:ketosteroid isomerase-like protein